MHAFLDKAFLQLTQLIDKLPLMQQIIPGFMGNLRLEYFDNLEGLHQGHFIINKGNKILNLRYNLIFQQELLL